MDNVKQQIVDRLKQANNILVTVKNDPSIDLLSACIGMALVLSKLDKHAAAVFSGEVPSAIEFLKPEETLEPTTNSLRDFIISLDKTKADKLRYKVEDKVVRIFITPYRTSLTQEDLEFSQGDFNIDVVVALGVKEQAELDAAVTAHGRILHDAAVVSINNAGEGNLGSLNWNEAGVSSVSEMVAGLAQALGAETLDEQIATALLTGIVAETQRFSNDKTTPQTMRVAGELMAAGANQQLVANELQADAKAVPHGDAAAKPSADDGTLAIAHAALEEKAEEPKDTTPAPEPELPQPVEIEPPKPEAELAPEIKVEAESKEAPDPDSGENIFTAAGHDEAPKARSYLVEQAATDQPSPEAEPSEFSPNSQSNGPDGVAMPLLSHKPSDTTTADASAAMPAPEQPANAATPAPTTSDPQKDQTLDQIEASVGVHDVPDVEQTAEPAAPAANTLDDARSQVLKALSEGPQPLTPPIAFNANPLGPPIHEGEPAKPETSPMPPAAVEPAKPTTIVVDEDGNIKPAAPSSDMQPMDLQLPPVMPPVSTVSQPQQAGAGTPPPPEPPPLMPPTFMAPPSNNAF